MKKFVCMLVAIALLFGSNAYACNATKQKVEFYYSALEANRDMNNHLKNGWFIHTLTMNRFNNSEHVLVVYEK